MFEICSGYTPTHKHVIFYLTHESTVVLTGEKCGRILIEYTATGAHRYFNGLEYGENENLRSMLSMAGYTIE